MSKFSMRCSNQFWGRGYSEVLESKVKSQSCPWKAPHHGRGGGVLRCSIPKSKNKFEPLSPRPETTGEHLGDFFNRFISCKFCVLCITDSLSAETDKILRYRIRWFSSQKTSSACFQKCCTCRLQSRNNEFVFNLNIMKGGFTVSGKWWLCYSLSLKTTDRTRRCLTSQWNVNLRCLFY